MKLDIVNNIRIITPYDGMWLCNERAMTISDKVYLGINADETLWRDITEEEKIWFEALWNAELPTENLSEIEQKARAYDILMGVSE